MEVDPRLPILRQGVCLKQKAVGVTEVYIGEECIGIVGYDDSAADNPPWCARPAPVWASDFNPGEYATNREGAIEVLLKRELAIYDRSIKLFAACEERLDYAQRIDNRLLVGTAWIVFAENGMRNIDLRIKIPDEHRERLAVGDVTGPIRDMEKRIADAG